MHNTADMLYYKITSEDYSPTGEMTVKYAAWLHSTSNKVSLQYKEKSCRIVKSIIETTIHHNNDPNTMSMLTEWADDLLSNKITELEGDSLLTGTVSSKAPMDSEETYRNWAW